jgi:5-methylcytosine-specific restriction endonuclease McrA
MINNNLLTPDLIEYLHHAGYIHIVQKLELLKTWKQYENISEEKFTAKTMPSGERWGRAMYQVYRFRINKHLVMENVNDNYKVENCDGCDTPFKKSEPECHHIIPKAQKFQGKSPEGPESPYNYAYLCINCHEKFTSQKPERKEIVNKLKEKELVTKKTVKKMILHDGLTKLQLDYLKAEKYIDEKGYEELLSNMKQMKDYLK